MNRERLRALQRRVERLERGSGDGLAIVVIEPDGSEHELEPKTHRAAGRLVVVRCPPGILGET